MPFQREGTIRMRETDATGVIYFGSLLDRGVILFEAFLEEGRARGILSQGFEYHLPLVHSSIDLKAPLRLGERIQQALSVTKIGNSSVSYRVEIHCDHREIAEMRFTHVAVDTARESATSLLGDFREWLAAFKKP